ncbi:MAG: DUF177 domain-containing protein [Ignavibacteria bacterium]|nr:DUF177 domain-containing protein [Ignavibacteria bacterium]
MMKIQLGSLSEGVHEYDFKATAEDLDLEDSFPGGASVQVVLEKTGNQIALEGSIRAEGRFLCDRCAGEFSLPLEDSYRMYYVTEGGGFEGIDPSELQMIPSASGSVDITDDVRQTLLLAVPFKLLCTDQCKGLCPHCGKNLNDETCSCTGSGDDTRWEALKALRGID